MTRTFAALAVVALAAVTASCSSHSNSKKDRADTITPATTKASAPKTPKTTGKGQLSVARLTRAHLTVSDLPTGWTISKDTSDSNDSSPGDPPCAHRFDDIEKLNSGANLAKGSFAKGSFGPNLAQTLASYPTAAKAKSAMSTLSTLFQQCQSFTATDPEDKTKSEFSIAPFSFPSLGDRTLAVAVTIKNSTISADGRLVYILTGQTIDYVAMVGIGGIDADQLEALARTSLTKLSKV